LEPEPELEWELEPEPEWEPEPERERESERKREFWLKSALLGKLENLSQKFVIGGNNGYRASYS